MATVLKASRVSAVSRLSRSAFTARRASVPRRSLQVSAFKVTLKTPEGDKVVECDGETFILDAAEDAGLNLPFSCRSGTCSSCAAIQVGGAPVDQADQNFLSEEQLEKGFVMTCVAYPTGDCTIETHKEEELY